MTETELKPCPFCGGKPDLGSYSSSGNWIVVCSKCEAETQIYETEQKAVKAWNTRPIEEAKDKEIKRLREALEWIVNCRPIIDVGYPDIIKKAKEALEWKEK